MKNRTEALAGNLKLSEVLEKPWTHLIVDFIIIKLPLVARKNTILVVYNRLSKMIYFVATTEEISVKELVRLFRDNIWKFHRLPKSMMLDRELQFAAKIIKKLNKMLEIETKLSITFHPQTDSQIERIN